MKILDALGYVTAKKAVELGFTHDGDYYGIPCWIGDVDGDFHVMTKWYPMELIMTMANYIEQLSNDMLQNQPSFKFRLHGEIKL